MDPIAAPALASPTVTDVVRIRGLLRQRQFAAALDEAVAQLGHAPDNRDLLLCRAVAERFLGRLDAALATLGVLERSHPGFSRLYEERGRCLVERHEASAAIAAFAQAVELNPVLPGSWTMLEGLYRLTGQPQLAAAAATEVATLRALPPEVVTASGLFYDGDLEPAEGLVRAFLLRSGDHVEAMRLLARIGMARRIFDDAEILLAAVLQREPGYVAARQEYAAVLVELHKYADAHREITQLLATDAGNPALKSLQATCLVGLGEHERAIGIYAELLRQAPGDADLHLWMAHALKTLGRRDPAIESYRMAARCRPDFGDAYWSLANLKTYRFTDAELAQLRSALDAERTPLTDRYHLSFALAKALEDRGEFAESFRYYELGNRLKRSESNYRAEIIENNTRQQVETCTAALFAARRGWGAPDPDPIFIVGLPRSGSTLLEQILASHTDVEGTQELANIQQIVTRLRGPDPDLDDSPYPRILRALGEGECRELGAQYLAGTRAFRLTDRPLFIDKMPNNFRHIGLIHLMLPNAKIIDARREPMACCFSNLKQLFANGQEFTYSVTDIARYYRTYLELMRHWDAVLPGRVLRMQHEDVVADLEGSVRRMLAFCGLEFQPACLEFYRTERSVRTASSEQVRQPIYRDGLDQWRNFEPWLGPLREALGDALERYRDA